MEAELSLVACIIAILVLIFITVIGLLTYSGLFTSFDISAGKPSFDSLTVAYKFARGPYKNAGELFTRVSALTPELRSIGVYYDDPQEVMPSELRYIVGAVLCEGKEEVKKEYESLYTENGFIITNFPAVSQAITTTFPFRNTLSIFIAVARVYPHLAEYIKTRSLCAHPMIEIYENDHIVFMVPLAKQDEFYVPEAKEDNSDEERTTSDGIQEISSHSDNISLLTDKSVENPLSGDGSPVSDNLTMPKSSTNGTPDDSAGSSFEELNLES